MQIECNFCQDIGTLDLDCHQCIIDDSFVDLSNRRRCNGFPSSSTTIAIVVGITEFQTSVFFRTPFSDQNGSCQCRIEGWDLILQCTECGGVFRWDQILSYAQGLTN